MEYQDEKRKLQRAVMGSNESRPSLHSFGAAVPREVVDKWERRFYASARGMTFSHTPRLINRFSLGADPELFFIGEGGEYIHAKRAGLNTLAAFGSDLTGRQAELRAHPSRSALEVVASLLDAMRWMYEAAPRTRDYNWVSVGFYGEDGAGGHVHFGRRRPDMEEIVRALSAMPRYFNLESAGIVHGPSAELRYSQTKYGKPFDYRAQTHGFEYRSLPTWLCSPQGAHLMLTLAKLIAVHKLSLSLSEPRIVNLLRAYQGADDDARIALAAIENFGFPQGHPEDIKKKWGIGQPLMRSKLGPLFFPASLPPSPRTIQELFGHLMNGNPMEILPVAEATWSPFYLPNGLFRLQISDHYPGLPEIAQNLLSKGAEVHIDGSHHLKVMVQTGSALDLKQIVATCPLPCGAIRRKNIAPDAIVISFPSERLHAQYVVNAHVVRKIRQWLTSGLFPIAHYRDIETRDTAKCFTATVSRVTPNREMRIQGGADIVPNDD